MKLSLRPFKLSSSLFFIIPGGIGIYSKNISLGLIPLLSFITSSLFHYHNESKYEKIDITFAYAQMTMNLILTILVGFGSMFIQLGLLFVGMSLYLYFNQHKSYNLYHGLWHLTSAIATSLFIIAFYVSS